MFASGYAAYEALSDGMKQLIADYYGQRRIMHRVTIRATRPCEQIAFGDNLGECQASSHTGSASTAR